MNGVHILVVDDDTHMRHFFGETVLRLEGYTVETAATAEEGLQRAKSTFPDLIITDMAMPGMTGLDMVEALRAAGYRLPVILTTAEGSEKIAVRALRAGVMDYFIKPFDIDDMLRAITRVISATRGGGLRADVIDQRTMQTVNTLISMGKSVTSLLDLELILGHVLEAAAYLSGADEAVLALLDQETGELYTRAHKAQGAHVPTHLHPATADEVVENGRTVYLEDARHTTANPDSEGGANIKSLLYVPLIADERVLGVLGLHNRQKQQPISARDADAIEALGEFANIAIANAHLYSRSQEEAALYTRLFDYVPEPLCLVNEEGYITLANTEACTTLADGDSLEGVWLADLTTTRDLEHLFQRASEEPLAYGEVTLHDGRVFQTQFGEVPGRGWLVHMTEITHLKELNRLKDELMTTMTHDLRAPLTAILSYMELMGRFGELNERQQSFAQAVAENVRAMTDLLRELVELQQLEVDRQFRPMALSAVVQRAYERMRSRAAAKGQTIEFTVAEEECEIIGNAIRLRQVFINLIDNAIKYTPEGGSVHVDVFQQDGQMYATVRDTGIGIPAEAQARIFERFYRAPQVNESHLGTGIGLYIVSATIKAHNGRIWVESTPEEGSTFTVMLPARCPET